jgi:hypothetical protein
MSSSKGRGDMIFGPIYRPGEIENNKSIISLMGGQSGGLDGVGHDLTA